MFDKQLTVGASLQSRFPAMLTTTLFLIVCGVCTYFALADRALRHQVSILRSQNASIQLSYAPSKGSHISILQGTSTDGKPLTIDLAHAKKASLLLVVSPTCRFCDKQMPVWKTLSDQIGAPNTIVADLSGSIQPAYLNSNSLSSNTRVILLDESEGILHKFKGTPTTVLVDRNGLVLASWAGVMSEAQVSNVNQLISTL